jgi:hypothetical protein
MGSRAPKGSWARQAFPGPKCPGAQKVPRPQWVPVPPKVPRLQGLLDTQGFSGSKGSQAPKDSQAPKASSSHTRMLRFFTEKGFKVTGKGIILSFHLLFLTNRPFLNRLS